MRMQRQILLRLTGCSQALLSLLLLILLVQLPLCLELCGSLLRSINLLLLEEAWTFYLDNVIQLKETKSS